MGVASSCCLSRSKQQPDGAEGVSESHALLKKHGPDEEISDDEEENLPKPVYDNSKYDLNFQVDETTRRREHSIIVPVEEEATAVKVTPSTVTTDAPRGGSSEADAESRDQKGGDDGHAEEVDESERAFFEGEEAGMSRRRPSREAGEILRFVVPAKDAQEQQQQLEAGAEAGQQATGQSQDSAALPLPPHDQEQGAGKDKESGAPVKPPLSAAEQLLADVAAMLAESQAVGPNDGVFDEPLHVETPLTDSLEKPQQDEKQQSTGGGGSGVNGGGGGADGGAAAGGGGYGGGADDGQQQLGGSSSSGSGSGSGYQNGARGSITDGASRDRTGSVSGRRDSIGDVDEDGAGGGGGNASSPHALSQKHRELSSGVFQSGSNDDAEDPDGAQGQNQQDANFMYPRSPSKLLAGDIRTPTRTPSKSGAGELDAYFSPSSSQIKLPPTQEDSDEDRADAPPPLRLTSPTSARKSKTGKPEKPTKQNLLLWCRSRVRGVDYEGILVQNFTTSWQDGRALCALIHSHNPRFLPEFRNLRRMSPEERLDMAINAASQHLDVPTTIFADDIARGPTEDDKEEWEQNLVDFLTELHMAMNP